MKNKSLILGAVVVLAGGAYFIGSAMTGSGTNTSESSLAEVTVIEKPERKAEVYGKVTKLEGNMITIAQIDLSADPTADMTTEEKQAYRQSLSDEEKMALKESSTSATLGEVTVLIPVGIPMSKKLEMGPDAPDVAGTLADISAGALLSVWVDEAVTDRQVAEFVKISTQK